MTNMNDNGDQFDEACAKRRSGLDQPIDKEWLDGQEWLRLERCGDSGVYTFCSKSVPLTVTHDHAVSGCTESFCIRIGDFHIARSPTRRQLLRLRDALEWMT